MINYLKYLVVAIVLVSLGGCFVPMGGGYYGGGGGDDDDAYQTTVNAPQSTNVDWPQIFQGYALPNQQQYNRDRPYYRNNDRNYYRQRQYEQRRYYQNRGEDDNRDEGDDGGDN
jgi:hypothetical protein